MIRNHSIFEPATPAGHFCQGLCPHDTVVAPICSTTMIRNHSFMNWSHLQGHQHPCVPHQQPRL